MSLFDITWSLHGRVVINGKFSHTAIIQLPSKHTHLMRGDEKSESCGLMLGTIDSHEKTIDQIIAEVENQCQRIVDNACKNLQDLRIKFNEYPFKDRKKESKT